LAAALQKNIERASNTINWEVQDSANRQLGEFTTELDDSRKALKDMKDQNEVNLGKARDGQVQALEQLQEEIRGANRQEASHFKEIAQVQNEVKGQANEIDKALENTQFSTKKELLALHNQAIGFPQQLDVEVDKAEEHAKVVAAEIEQGVKKKLKGVKREIDATVNDLQKTMMEKNDELKSAMQTQTTDVTAQRMNSAKEINARLEETLAKQHEVESQLHVTAKEAQSVRDYARRQNDAVNEKLGQEAHNLQDTLAQANGVFTSAKAQVLASTYAQVSKMKDDIVDNLRDSETKIKDDLAGRITKVNNDISKGAEDIAATRQTLDTAVVDLNGQISDNRANVANVSAALDVVKKSMGETNELLTDQFNETRANAMVEIAGMNKIVQGEIKKTHDEVNERSEKNEKDLTANLDSTEKALIGQVEGIRAPLEASMKSANDAAKEASGSAQSLLDRMETVKHDIREEKNEISDAVPHVKATVKEAIKNVQNSINKVEDEVSSSKDEISKELVESQRKISAQSQKEVSEATQSMGAEMHDSETKLSNKMDGMMASLGQLKADSTREVAANSAEEQRLHSQLESAIERAAKISDQSGVKGTALAQKMAQASNELKSAQKEESLQIHTAATELGEQAQARLRDAEEKVGEKMHGAIAKSTASLETYEKRASSQIATDESKLQDYQSDTASKISTLSGNVKHLGFDLEKSELSTERSNHELTAKLADLAKGDAMLEQKSSEAGKAEKIGINQEAQALGKLIQEKVHDMSVHAAQSVQEMSKETNDAYAAEKQSEQSEESRVYDTVKGWSHKMSGEIQDIDKAVSGTRSGLNSYKASETQAETNFANEISGLNTQVKSGQAKAQQAVDSGDRQVGQEMASELSGMDGLLAVVARTKAKFTAEIGGMKTGFSNQLDSYNKKGHAEADDISAKLAELNKKGRDLAASFHEASSNGRRGLSDTQSEMDSIVNTTQRKMDEFHTEIKDVRKRREQEAMTIHEESGALKGEMTQQMGETVERVEAMRSQTSQKFEALSNEQEQYDKKLAATIGMSNNREQQEIAKMQQKITDLEANKARLLEWQTAFKRRTAQWKDDVEKRIHTLTQPGKDPNLREESSLLETGEEVDRLRKLRDDLMNDDSKLINNKSKLQARAHHLQKILITHGISPAV